eukprot:2215627-Alexandrium_andersonii.AAC.1
MRKRYVDSARARCACTECARCGVRARLKPAPAKLAGHRRKPEGNSPTPKGAPRRGVQQAKTLAGKPQTPMPRGAANVQLTCAQGCSATGQPVGGAEPA